MEFVITSVKTCRRHSKFVLGLPLQMDHTFLQHFSMFGQVQVVRFSEFSPASADCFKIRSESFGFELSGPVNGYDLKATFRKDDHEMIDMVWKELTDWVYRKKEKVA